MTPTPAQPRTPDRDSPETTTDQPEYANMEAVESHDGTYWLRATIPSNESTACIVHGLRRDTAYDLARAYSIAVRACLPSPAVRAAVAEPSGKADWSEFPIKPPPREGFTYPDSAVEWAMTKYFSEVPDDMQLNRAMIALRASRVATPLRKQEETPNIIEEPRCDDCGVKMSLCNGEWVCDNYNCDPDAIPPATPPPAPQPEAATGERPCPKCSNAIYERVCPVCGRLCYDGQAWIAPPPPTVETAEGWRSKCPILSGGDNHGFYVTYAEGPRQQWLRTDGQWTDRWKYGAKWLYFPSPDSARAALAKAPPPPGVEPARTTVTLTDANARAIGEALRGHNEHVLAQVIRDALAAALKGTP